MKKVISIAIVLLIATIGIATADKQTGAVMASDINGDDTNIYPETDIYIKGVNLAPDTSFSWEIYDMDAGCTTSIPGIGCGTKVNESSGGSTNGDGDISPPYPTGWSIPNGDYSGHDYKLIVTFGPNDSPYATFYTKVDTLTPVPEIATIGLVSAGLVGLFLVARKRRNK